MWIPVLQIYRLQIHEDTPVHFLSGIQSKEVEGIQECIILIHVHLHV